MAKGETPQRIEDIVVSRNSFPEEFDRFDEWALTIPILRHKYYVRPQKWKICNGDKLSQTSRNNGILTTVCAGSCAGTFRLTKYDDSQSSHPKGTRWVPQDRKKVQLLEK